MECLLRRSTTSLFHVVFTSASKGPSRVKITGHKGKGPIHEKSLYFRGENIGTFLWMKRQDIPLIFPLICPQIHMENKRENLRFHEK